MRLVSLVAPNIAFVDFKSRTKGNAMVNVIVGRLQKRLAAIPDSVALRETLRDLIQQAARIRILLRVATELERVPERELSELAAEMESGVTS